MICRFSEKCSYERKLLFLHNALKGLLHTDGIINLHYSHEYLGVSITVKHVFLPASNRGFPDNKPERN